MKRWNYAMLALCLAATTVACAGDRAPDADRPADATPGTPGAAGTAGTAARDATPDPAADRDFVGDMTADGHAEVELGKLAQQKARNAQVKEFAAMMVRDHQNAGTELKTAAAQANIETAAIYADTDEHKDLRERLAKLSGTEFDREYIEAMVDDHEKAVNDVEDKAERAGSDHVKQWAARTLPTLKKHLEQAKQIQDSLEKRSGS
jgi:putative membrane protein